MKYARQMGVFGVALGTFSGCSGKYQVGTDVTNPGLTGAGAPSVGTATAGAPSVSTATAGAPSLSTATAGAPSQGGASGTVPGESSGAGGVYAVGGSFSNPPLASFCGNTLPTDSIVQFAPPSVVYRRVSKFVFDVDATATTPLPSETTRKWAGDLAATMLLSLSVPSAKGMNRFVTNWWTGTPTPELWAPYFSRGTLIGLLTTSSMLQNGSGLLTDPAVLGNDGISSRGRFLIDRLLGMAVPAPPPDTTTVLPPPMPGQTRRSTLEAEVAPQPCKSCHVALDPFGYALGNFATDGSWRALDNELPIDTTATLMLPYSGAVTVLDAQDLGRVLSNSCEAALGVTRQMLHDAAVCNNRPDRANLAEASLAAAQFTAKGLKLSELVRFVAESDSFLSVD